MIQISIIYKFLIDHGLTCKVPLTHAYAARSSLLSCAIYHKSFSRVFHARLLRSRNCPELSWRPPPQPLPKDFFRHLLLWPTFPLFSWLRALLSSSPSS